MVLEGERDISHVYSLNTQLNFLLALTFNIQITDWNQYYFTLQVWLTHGMTGDCVQGEITVSADGYMVSLPTFTCNTELDDIHTYIQTPTHTYTLICNPLPGGPYI